MTIFTFVSQTDYRGSSDSKPNTQSECFVETLTQYFSNLRTHENKSLYFLGTSYDAPPNDLLTPRQANNSLKHFHLCLLDYLAGASRINRPWFRRIEPAMHSFTDIPASKTKNYQMHRTHLRCSSFHHHSILVANCKRRSNNPSLKRPDIPVTPE